MVLIIIIIIIIIIIKLTLKVQITLTKLHKCAAALQSSTVKQECLEVSFEHKELDNAVFSDFLVGYFILPDASVTTVCGG